MRSKENGAVKREEAQLYVLRRLAKAEGKSGTLLLEVIVLKAAARDLAGQVQHLMNAITFSQPKNFGADNLCYEARIPTAFVDDAKESLTVLNNLIEAIEELNQ